MRLFDWGKAAGYKAIVRLFQRFDQGSATRVQSSSYRWLFDKLKLKAITYYASSLGTKFQMKGSSWTRQHAAPDPLFEIRRKDRRRNITLNIEPSTFRIGGLTPVLELGYEKNDSTLPLSNYNRVIVSMSLKRSY